ncbi:hypothetical protein OPT61_g3367 [Boeremia exigua]|uniref:Uncharacterized protein n=1 Tax=Boeremia exigua TaxID=749465 RepID=A0ACC2II67_9PLEO|nr:hypothetical protein OPT61_g3367 [Boeremia exigua]
MLRRTAARQILTRNTRRNLSIEPQAPPPQPPKQPSKVGAFYKSFSAPILKCFLGALFTYQLAYFGWLKLETIEEAHEKRTEIKGLQEELASAINNKRREAEGVAEKVGDKIGEAKGKVLEGTEKAKKGGWWPCGIVCTCSEVQMSVGWPNKNRTLSPMFKNLFSIRGLTTDNRPAAASLVKDNLGLRATQ